MAWSKLGKGTSTLKALILGSCIAVVAVSSKQ